MGLMQQTIFEQAVLFLAALVVFTSFLMLAQRRLFPLVGLFAWQGLLLALTTALVAFNLHYPHLYASALMTLLIKARVQIVAGSALGIALLLLQTLVFLAVSGALVLAAGGAAVVATQQRRSAAA